MKKVETPINATIINHFYVYGMDLTRSNNPSLDGFKIVTNGNQLHYVDKKMHVSENEVFFQTESQL